MKSTGQDSRSSIHGIPADQGEMTRRTGDEQFRELMAHLQQAFWIKNAADDALLYISPACETMYGSTCERLYEGLDALMDAIHPQDRKRMAGTMAAQRETGGYEEEYRIVRPDGAIRWIWARSYPVRDDQGQVIRFAGIAEDVTERKELEQDRARLAAIVEYSQDAIVSMSVDCIITSWNHGAERQYGYTSEEILGFSLSVLFPPQHYEEYLQILKNVRKGEPVASCGTVRRRKDGTLINTAVNIFPIEARNGDLVGASKIGRDVSAIKKLETQFIEAQKMEVVGQLAAGMAHDFNNLLSIILGCSDLMLATLGAGAPQRKDVETIRKAAERAAGLTRELLIFSRKERATPVVLDLNDVMESLDEMLRQLIDEKIDLTMVQGEPLGRIRADAGHIGQLLMNLLLNARDAMPTGGKLTVTTSNVILDDEYTRAHAGLIPGNYVLLTVSDTGTGFSDEVKAKLFEPFFTTKPKGKGTGLGLSTCETIVRQYDGHIEVSSVLGKGSTFKVYFPAVGEPLDASIQPTKVRGPLPTGTETLLVVEGERPVRTLACGVLESLGYTVLRASSDQDGLRLARTYDGQPIRLMISDACLAEMSDAALTEWQKSICPGLRILLTSECAEDDFAPERVSATGIAFLPKPYTPTQLAYKVRALLDR